jgi:hypothetical protein
MIAQHPGWVSQQRTILTALKRSGGTGSERPVNKHVP